MEITVFELVLYILSFGGMFFIPGHFLLKKKPMEEKFVVSSFILFVVTLLLSTTIGLTAISLIVSLVLLTIILAYLSANP